MANEDVEETYSTLSLNVTHDEYENTDLGLFIDWELPTHQRIHFNYNKSLSEDEYPDTQQISLGISTDTYDTFSLAMELDYWGNGDYIETRSLRSELTLNTEDWSLAYSPQLSIVSIDMSLLQVRQGVERLTNELNLYSLGHQFSISYLGFENYLLLAKYFRNKFSETLTNQSKNSLGKRITVPKFSQLSNLEKSRIEFGISRFFSWGSIGVDWLYSDYEFLDDTSALTLLGLDYMITESISITFSAGAQISSTDNSTSNLFGTSLNFYW